jgi:hypothetical protein
MRNSVETGTASNPKGELNIYICFPPSDVAWKFCHKTVKVKTTLQSVNARAMIWLLWDIATRRLETDTDAVCK